MTRSKTKLDSFITSFSREIEENNAAVFVGAGLSVGAGFVDWKNLLRPIASELDLDIDRETDLVTLAQYHVNETGNRDKLNRVLVAEFSKNAKLSENHRLLAKLPITIFWTTNYDQLIEQALKDEDKKPDVKHSVNQLHLTKPGRDAVVYKMHGDVDLPTEAVVTKDDYERYPLSRQAFLTALSGDLVARTFLFLGLSFRDPNIDYVLGRIRAWYEQSARNHYAILKQVKREDYAKKAEFDYATRHQGFFARDLARFGIRVLFIQEYKEIGEILNLLYERNKSRSVLISGSAHEYGKRDRASGEALVRKISAALVDGGYRIVSGFGLGIGSAVIAGALERIYTADDLTVSERLILRPFPFTLPRGEDRAKMFTRYRQDIVNLAGVAIFVFGNRAENGKIVNGPGVIEEFELAAKSGLKVLPIGATGYASRELWQRVIDDTERYLPGAKGIKRLLARLGKNDLDDESIVATLIDILRRLAPLD